jgi:integrase
VKGVLRHVELKTDASRRLLALPPTLVDVMRRHREHQQAEREVAGRSWRSTGFVFTTIRGDPLDGTVVTHSFQRLLRRAGLPRMRFHDLRHGCASLLLAEGGSIRGW